MRTQQTAKSYYYIFPILLLLGLAKLPAYGQELHTPYPIIFVHGLKSDDNTWNEMVYFLSKEGLSFGGRMDFCLNQDGNLNTSKLPEDYKDYTNATPLHAILKGDFYSVNFDVNNVGELYEWPNINESNQSAIVKQGRAISDAVRHVIDVTGAQKVILVGHSMGGLASREYLQNKEIWYEPNIDHHVAKLCTIGTPHGGSNATDWGLLLIGGVADPLSEAIRDLRTSYLFSYGYPLPLLVPASGTYLFGGVENLDYMRDMEYKFNNADVNCDGNANDDVIAGLNFRYYPKNLAYACIVGSGDKLGGGGNVFISGDGVVSTKSANLNNYLSVNADVFMVYKPFDLLSVWHSELTKQIEAITQVLDEPDDPELAYIIGENSTNKGFITLGPYGNPVDIDLFKIIVSKDGIIKINVEASSFTGIRAINLLDQFENPIQSITDISQAIEYEVTAGTYYVQVRGIAVEDGPDIPGSYFSPYTLKSQFEATPPAEMAVFPSSLPYYDVVMNSPKDKTITLTNNGTNSILITSIGLLGADASQFAVAPMPPFAVTPELPQNLTVTFNPTSAGAKDATIEITTNSPDIPTKTVSLKGNGTDHETKVLVCNPAASYNFGDTKLDLSRSKIFMIQNTGSNTCIVSDLALEGANLDQYSITSSLVLPFNLETGETKQIIVKFSPSSIGVKSVELAITNNSDNLSPKYSIELYGNGTENYYSGNNSTIVAYEYWFDDNYTAKIYTPITPQQEAALNSTFSTEGLNVGLHHLHLRYIDAKGHWSSVVSEVFYKIPNVTAGPRKITSYEYWFDSDYSSKVITSIAPEQVYNLNSSIASDALPVGLHSFHSRFRDDASQWSSVVTEVFYKLRNSSSLPNLITEYRYWYDLDHSNVNSVVLPSPVNPYQLIKDINTCKLTGGAHTLHFQFKDTRQAWSSVISEPFNVESIQNPVISANGPLTICPGSSVTLTSSPSNNYLWNNGATTQSIDVSDAGIYYVNTDNGCSQSLVSNSITITVNPLPLVPATPLGADFVDLQKTVSTEYSTLGASYADSYAWSVMPEDAGVITGSDLKGTVIWNPNYLGYASIKAMSVNSCGKSALSNEKQTFVDNITGLSNAESLSLKIFPNPNNGSFFINASKSIKRVIISDVLGKTINEYNNPNDNQLFENNLTEGVYLVHIFIDDREFIRKIIVKKER